VTPTAATLPPLFADWFAKRGWSLRRHQAGMIAAGVAGRHALLVAPTGGGKTLAGFLPSLIELAERGPRPEFGPGSGIHTIYISPLKALTTDVERNLMTPIREIGLNIHVESRTGDTKQSKKQRQRDFPPDILLTTPEQLALFCAWDGARAYFADLKCIVLDEVHAIWSGKRGDLLSLGLARLAVVRARHAAGGPVGDGRSGDRGVADPRLAAAAPSRGRSAGRDPSSRATPAPRRSSTCWSPRAASPGPAIPASTPSPRSMTRSSGRG
jgi:ATP-dependent Lhr-like helicase